MNKRHALVFLVFVLTVLVPSTCDATVDLIQDVESLRNSLTLKDPSRHLLTLRLADLYFDRATELGTEVTHTSPDDLAKVMSYYVGSWSVEGTMGDTPFKGRAYFRMPVGNHCTMGTVSFRAEKELISFSLVSGWDSSTGWVTEQGSGSDGTVYTLQWRKVSETVDEGEVVGTLNGKKVTEKNRLERKGKDDYVVVCTERTEGDKSMPDITFKFHRRPKEKSKQKAKK